MSEFAGARSLSQPHSSDEEDEDINSKKSPKPTAATPLSKTKHDKIGAGDCTGATPEVPKKPRGRPPGSKNKPKPPVVITRESEAAMQPMVLEVSAGSDVVDTVAHFATRRHVGLCVLSGSGTVANVTLRHPSSPNATLTIPGCFEIISLSGSLLPLNSSTTTCNSSPLTISIAGGQGQVIGGAVAGALTAVSPVVLVAASFVNPAFHRLPLEEEEVVHEDVKPNITTDHQSGCTTTNTTSTSISIYNGSTSVATSAAATPLNCQIPSDNVLHWAPTSSRAPPPPY